ncbi:DNA mismatch repair endonuclease MutL [Priestia megaterium]|uniref:DNA mismatch repair protein MutL n=2 Tax=Priestia megaterium TaxID=1404 RepID=A0A6M6DMB9_PRIMG|nr:DNA mismatch repair endonuclease MutL [Priestia megaterium]MCJ7990488.1 DNA mismatch repair endonuclease MutL [Priestia sp. OVS21]AJI21053.1 DNA mismatch repair protein mutL [Priestia megaterium NBRC 15308 = ATCC 14581]AYE49608.1 DNA mismatch repair endonuclease MutL [Priestia megaterium NCT-2]KFN00661.1 DNA mismatch repair protein mutL [Priestia megaterium]KGJ73236.1 DNA mismatch repair protein MutL [Priestia megaterium NBRC 15308 = ATCC 14581]
MGKIVQLSDELSNKIAAGEVVERPASVVKELVENAIDANSTVIEIELEEAGLSKIRILDNGDGIASEDCLTAFKRHATSKIKTEQDLFRIRTLGFRGEALPSIASVSMLELKTSTGEEAGTHLKLRGGEIVHHELTSSRKGTELVIENLFFNTPARLKYMKTVNTELGNVTDVVNRLAMSHPEVSIRLMHQGRQLLYTNGSGDVRQVLAAIYGMAVAKKMIPINVQSLDYEVNGYVALPEITRASRNYMSTIINGRFVKNYGLLKAVQQGYHTLLPIGRFPIVFLTITMDPLLVDVNVHPAKLEVRLSKEAELFELIEQGVKAAFKKQQLIPDAVVPTKSKSAVQPTEQQTFTFDHQSKTSGYQPSNTVREPSFKEAPARVDEIMPPVKTEVIRQDEELQPTFREIEHYEESVEENAPIPEPNHSAEDQPEPRVPAMYPIGQMHGTYILAQNEKGLFIIDQHAAQERIKYEYFKRKLGEVDSEVQELLMPLTLEFSGNEALILEEYKDMLAEVGVFLEPFGQNSYIVRSHPQWFPKGEEQETIEEMIQQIFTMKRVNIEKLREEAAIMMSCKGSIKANHHLRNDEIFALLETLRKTTDPFTCPHGRPIIIHHSTYEMEKMFKRVM